MIRRYGQVNFTLGACTLFRRDALAAIGGWKSFGEDLGEDQRIGAALVRAGQVVHLSRHVATLDSDAISWREYWRHQRRVAVTYRAGNAAGFAGMAVTYGPVWGLLGFLMCPRPVFAVALVATFVFRAWRVWRTMRLVDFEVPGMLAALGVTSVVEALCWARSWFPTRVWWSGRWWRVDFRGKFSREAETENRQAR
jgi:ceramide glucosyltransferase